MESELDKEVLLLGGGWGGSDDGLVGLHCVPPEGDVGLLGTVGSRGRSLYGL